MLHFDVVAFDLSVYLWRVDSGAVINDLHIAQLIRSLDFVELHLVLSLSLL